LWPAIPSGSETQWAAAERHRIAERRRRRRVEERRRRVRARRRNALGAGALVALLVGVIAGSGGGSAGGGDDAEAGSRPNFVVVMTDDQDVASLEVMANVRGLLVEEGVRFANSFVSLPVCCPSRATFLSGRYAHNHGVLLADPDPTQEEWVDKARRLEKHTLALWLQEAGYSTALVGKYMNGYGDFDRTEIPPGWDEWISPAGERSIYGYEDFTLNENGELAEYAGEESYQTDVLTDRAVDVIDRSAGEKPFFLYVAYVAPHIGRGGSRYCAGSARPAVRHQGAFEGVEVPQPPSFGEDDVSDKPEHVQDEPDLDEDATEDLSRAHRCRLESLLAVDEGVGRIVDALAEREELDDTVVIFTSDNGWLAGQHRLRASKFFPYEESVRVPLIMRGAGGDAGSEVVAPALNVDLAPTILELAGAEPDIALDGFSLLPALEGGELPDRDLLFEGYYSNATTGFVTERHYAAIRQGQWQYTEYRSEEKELYDLAADPYQLENMAGDPEYADIESQLAAALEELADCAGGGGEGFPGVPECW
jgi:arylsulfatase A-like enzyme